MGMASDMRAWLATQDGPRTVCEIAAGLPDYDPNHLAQAAHRMWRDGLFTRSGKCRHYAFGLGREPVVRKLPPGERKRRRAIAESARGKLRRQRMIETGKSRSRAEWLAECAARTAAAQARKVAAKAKCGRDRAAEREARSATPRPKPAPQPRKVRERVHVAPAPAPVAYQSVDDFIANGGKVERLEPGACSKPLKRIGKPGVFTITRRAA